MIRGSAKIWLWAIGTLATFGLIYGKWTEDLNKPAHTFEGGFIISWWMVVLFCLSFFFAWALRRSGRR